MNFKHFISLFLVAVISSLLSFAVFNYANKTEASPKEEVSLTTSHFPNASFATYSPDVNAIEQYPDLTNAAEKAVNSVVHVKVKGSKTAYSSSGNPLFDFFYGYREQNIPTENFGSGVILSADGYIVTNNHVIENGDAIEVVMNDKRTFSARIVGTDPTTDLALLKVDETGLPFLTFGDAESLRVGEWVLAVGNPYNLTSTVTAGIISAKARNLGIITREMAIESFIQTDAAVNPGNSGGALVNREGFLIGINTAISSPTGAYSGNAFAIPSTIVAKVVSDLKEFGVVQRAILGVQIQEITDQLAQEKNLSQIDGIYVSSVNENSPAAKAGIKTGDIITHINAHKVNTVPELQEQVAKYRPNDKISVTVVREKKSIEMQLTLLNIEGSTEKIKGEQSILGATFEEVSRKERQNLNISSGIKVKDVGKGKLQSLGIRNSFIITAVNDKPVNSTADIKKIIDSVEQNGKVLISGTYPNGQIAYYVFAK